MHPTVLLDNVELCLGAYALDDRLTPGGVLLRVFTPQLGRSVFDLVLPDAAEVRAHRDQLGDAQVKAITLTRGTRTVAA